MNRVINKYGALNHLTPEGQAVQQAMRNVSRVITDVISRTNLTPEETIAFEHHVMAEVSASFASDILKKAINMRAKEKYDQRLSNH